MLILVINAGSSSIKYQLIDMETEKPVAKGLCERIGIDGRITHQVGGQKYIYDTPLKNHAAAFSNLVSILSEGENAVIRSMNDVTAIGHRMVTGCETYRGSVAIDSDVMQFLNDTIEIAPLHAPAMIEAVRACGEVFGKDKLQVAVFDASFHITMEPKAFLYALPYEYYTKYGYRKWGYHGNSYRYVASRLESLCGKPADSLKVVACHLGNGSSVAAIDGGKSVDTSMGYTPLDGLMMGTRTGALDPSLISHIAAKENLSIAEVDTLLNKKSGFLGISGVSSDSRDIEQAANGGNERARICLEMFAYQVKRYIGAYTAAMNGVDVITFSGGIGENSASTRAAILSDLSFFGIELDEEKNADRSQPEREISKAGSRVKIWIVPTNEEIIIARDTYAIFQAQNKG